jgi:hypothetical protein
MGCRGLVFGLLRQVSSAFLSSLGGLGRNVICVRRGGDLRRQEWSNFDTSLRSGC